MSAKISEQKSEEKQDICIALKYFLPKYLLITTCLSPNSCQLQRGKTIILQYNTLANTTLINSRRSTLQVVIGHVKVTDPLEDVLPKALSLSLQCS